MITFSEHKQHEPMAFDEYMRMKGYSHSYLKYNQGGSVPQIEVTLKMQLGSIVDAILTGGKSFPPTTEMYQEAKAIAYYMGNNMPYLGRLRKQIPCTAIAEYAGLQLSMKTLPDFLLPRIATVEMKVSDIHSKQAEAMIQHMGYDNQCFIERSLANVPKSYLLVYCRKSKDVYFRERACENAADWLCEQILKFGVA